MASQVHRYDCPLGREMTLATIRKRFEVGSWDSADLVWLYHRAETWPEMLTTLEGAYHCIKSYEYGNASPDLAQEWAAELEAAIRNAKEERNVSK